MDGPEKAVNTDAEEPGCDARDFNFYRAYLRTACVGDGRARIPLQYVLTEVIVGQGLDVAQEQMPGWPD
ncbi:MAG: hypothetical protein M3Q91_08130 [Acidobacteriota bacterium]|nr:hypothetical protein [Acidobacteriota bacterium]